MSDTPISPAAAADVEFLLSRHARAIVIFPIAFVATMWLPALFRGGFRFFEIITTENGPVEMPTFFFAAWSAWLAFRYALTLRHHRERAWVWLFYLIFSAGMFFIAGEEIAWGQKFIQFQTPDYWSGINAQHETTLHNLAPLQGHSEYFRLVFCVGCIIGLLAGRVRIFARVAASPLLWSWLAVMTPLVVVDTINDYWAIQPDDRHGRLPVRAAERRDVCAPESGPAVVSVAAAAAVRCRRP
jgi:hypothetical protein